MIIPYKVYNSTRKIIHAMINPTMMPYKIYNKKTKTIHALILTDCEYTACGHHIVNRKNWKLDIEQFIESEECCKKCVKSLKKEGIL